MSDLEIVGMDLETDRFGPCNLAPRPICLSIHSSSVQTVLSTADPEFDDAIVYALENYWVNAFTAFDAAVILAWRPKLRKKVFDAYRQNRVTCVLQRERLLVLGTIGTLKFEQAPDGSNRSLIYKLSELEKKYLGIDRSDLKDEEDSWRFNYVELEGKRADEYNDEQRNYVQDDSTNAVLVHEHQDAAAGPMDGGQHPFTTEHFQARSDLGLYLQSCVGLEIDQEYAAVLREHFGAQFQDEKFPSMLREGILRPHEPSRPHKTQMKAALACVGLPSTVESCDWGQYRTALEGRGIRFTAPKNSSINETKLMQMVEEISVGMGLEVQRTATGRVALNAEALSLLHGSHEVVDEYTAREEISTLVGQFLPNLDHPVVHPKYTALVETGRTSSYGNSKKNKKPSYPSINIQNVDPRAREVVVAPEGWVICSVDFDYLELVSAAQRCLWLFGRSELANAINSGKDPHAWLGTSIAGFFDAKFADACTRAGIEDQLGRYEAFQRLKDIDPKTRKHWRDVAKPTGLGYWGGLGADTFIAFARSQWGVDLIKIAGSFEAAREMAKQLKDVWMRTYPETQAYFQWVEKECKDLDWCDATDTKFQYVSPLGMIRRNCSYCAATNGIAMQTPAAEGAKQAVWRVAEACWDDTLESPLYGCKPFAFIHDQIMAYMPLDRWTHERAHEMARIMRQAMEEILPDVKVGASPVLMLRWNKDAESVVDHDGRLAIWHPKEVA